MFYKSLLVDLCSMQGSKSCLVLVLWTCIIGLSTLKAQTQRSLPNTINLKQLCPALLSSHEITSSNDIPFINAILPLADERAVVFPCRLKTEIITAEQIINNNYYSPNPSVVVHYFNVSSVPANYSTDEFKPCQSFVNFKHTLTLDTKSCNFYTNFNLNYYKQFVYWSNEDNGVILNLNPHHHSMDAKYLQIYYTLFPDTSSFHTCKIQQYYLSTNLSTSCSSIDFESRLHCAEFDCSLFRSGRFQSLLNLTYSRVKVLRVSEDEIRRVIVATICPVLIVSSVVLLTCAIISCKSSLAKKQGMLSTQCDEEVVSTLSRNTESPRELHLMNPELIKDLTAIKLYGQKI